MLRNIPFTCKNSGKIVPQQEEITLASLNVLHEPIAQRERYVHQTETLLPMVNAHIYCLQEVTPKYMTNYLSKCPFFHGQDSAFTMIADPLAKHFGNVILTNLPIIGAFAVHCAEFARTMPMVIVQLHQCKLAVICVHLKAHATCERVRKQQWQHLASVMHQYEHLYDACIIAGDTNMRTIKEDRHLPKNIVDLWPIHKKDTCGYTYDPHLNKMIDKMWPNEENKLMRLDRILVKQKNNLKVTSMSLFATQALIPEELIFASDHFGICADFVVNNEAVQ